MSLRQNLTDGKRGALPFDYQSGCHCAKTPTSGDNVDIWFDYQSGCHCAKTIS